jgi:HSP20 family protein
LNSGAGLATQNSSISSASASSCPGRTSSASVIADLVIPGRLLPTQFQPVQRRFAGSRPVYLPPADVYETKDSIVVLAEMPGVAADGVDISLERRVLTIRGRSAANDHSRYQRVYNEYADGDYERVFTLSENIDRDRIEATLRDGVLQLVLPKAEAAKPRKIELKTS